MTALQGVLSVLCTPFHDDGSLDEQSLRRLVEHNLAWGVAGLVCFGLAGEVYKLTDDERRRVLRLTLDVVDGAVPVIAGTEHNGVEGAVARSHEAAGAGASALMLYPPSFVKPDRDGVVEYYAAVGAVVDVPIIIQDAPAWTGVSLPVDVLATLHGDVANVGYVKVEAPPTPPKIRALTDAGVPVIGGYGALHLAEELTCALSAVMPGCAAPGLYTALWRTHQAHDPDGVWSIFQQALPLLAFQMSSLDVFVAVQKLLLHRMDVIASPHLRRPGKQLSPEQLRWLDQLIVRTDFGDYLGTTPSQ